MNITGFIWIDSIVEKLEVKHGVTSNEVEEVFRGNPWIKKGPLGHRPGERGYYCFGQTSSGRYLFIFFVIKRDKKALVVTARDMTQSEKRLYAKKK